jgi:hydroxyquinol 1,2-dioxygenase
VTQETTGPAPLLVTEDTITDLAVQRWGTARDLRLAELLTALVRHLHDFAREVRLTEDEWMAAISWLTRTGQISDEKRQEFILASDVLGLSMLVVQMNHRFDESATPATVLGPFYIEGSPDLGYGDDMSDGVDGEPLFVHGTVRDLDGRPVAGALLDVWQADAEGAYEAQLEVDEARLRGRFRTREDGTYCVRTIAPKGYTIPMDGTVGDLISRTEISEYRPAHVHFRLDVPGFEPLVTHLFREGAPYLDSDVVFGTKEQLVVRFERHDGGTTPTGAELDGPWLEARYDFVLQPAGTPSDGSMGGRG